MAARTECSLYLVSSSVYPGHHRALGVTRGSTYDLGGDICIRCTEGSELTAAARFARYVWPSFSYTYHVVTTPLCICALNACHSFCVTSESGALKIVGCSPFPSALSRLHFAWLLLTVLIPYACLILTWVHYTLLCTV